MKDYSLKTLESMSQARWYNKYLLRLIEPYLKGDTLEVGAGIGNFTTELRKDSRLNVWAIDINKKYQKELQTILGDNAGWGDIEKGQYFFSSKKFETIILLNVLEHIKDDQQALENLVNLLRPQGLLILLLPAHQFLYGSIDESIDHYRRYNKKAINKLLQQRLSIIYSRRINMLGALGWYVSGKILKCRYVTSGNIKIFNLLAPIFLHIESFFNPPFGLSYLIVAKKK